MKGLRIIKRKLLVVVLLVAAIITGVVAYASGDVRVYVNGMRLDEPVLMNNDRTYIPLRAVSEAMGADVNWDGDSRTAYITFSEDDAIAKLVSDVSPSVVTIVGNYNGKETANSYNNPTMHGSGIIYRSNGHIVTNAHVVADIKNLTVVLNDGTMVPGNVLYSDEKADVAVIKIDKLGLKPITMADKSTIVSGKTAIAIGTPISLSMRNTVTKGIICGSDVVLNDSYYKLIQTDATVNPGNSGGPLINTKGELVGINSSKYASVGIDNMAFAIPVDTVEYVIAQFEKYGHIVRPDLNFELEQSWEAKIGLPTKNGLTVKRSENASLSAGDAIVSVNGIDVHSIADWNEAIKKTYNGKSLRLKCIRNSVAVDIEIQI